MLKIGLISPPLVKTLVFQKLAKTRVLYDRVWKRKICFEITAFLNYERGTSRAGKFKTSNENKKQKRFCFLLMF